MPDEIDALMGLIPAEDTAGQSAVANALRGQQKMGNFYSLSPTLGDYGKDMASSALTSAKQAGDRRQQGLTRTRQTTLDEEKRTQRDRDNTMQEDALELEQTRYDEELALNATNATTKREQELADAKTKNAHALELQRLKDEAARQRAVITAGGKTKMGTAEKKNYRIASTATSALPAIIAQVEATPDAFGPTKDAGSYLPDFTPNVITEATKNWQKTNLTDKQQLARNAVYEQAYQIINELAGAALSVHEKTRIEAFTPAPNDDARTVANKLRSAQEAANRLHTSFDMYSDYEPLAEAEAEVELDEAGDVNAMDARIAELEAKYPQGGGE